MSNSMIKKLNLFLTFLLFAFLPMLASANEMSIGVTAPIDATDYASLQRGAKTFVNN